MNTNNTNNRLVTLLAQIVSEDLDTIKHKRETNTLNRIIINTAHIVSVTRYEFEGIVFTVSAFTSKVALSNGDSVLVQGTPSDVMDAITKQI